MKIDEDLDFDDLGIIELEDEEWNEYYDDEQRFFSGNFQGFLLNQNTKFLKESKINLKKKVKV
jgi:hypothetical protein